MRIRLMAVALVGFALGASVSFKRVLDENTRLREIVASRSGVASRPWSSLHDSDLNPNAPHPW